MQTVRIAWIMIAAPDTKQIFNGKNNDRDQVKNPEERCMWIMNSVNSFQHNSCYIQDDKDNNKAIKYLIPFAVSQFRMKKDMHFPFTFMISHRGQF